MTMKPMTMQEFDGLPPTVRNAILDTWLTLESESEGIDPRVILKHAGKCTKCREILTHRLCVFIAVNVDAVYLTELMPSQSNPWSN
jgi:hypothetical protein